MKSTSKSTSSGVHSIFLEKYRDPITPGLCAIIDAAGRKSWVYRRRVAKTPTVVQLKLGTYPTYSLAEARDWATKLNQAAERGVDPRAVLRAERILDEMTVENAHGLYLEALRRGDRKSLKPRTLYDKAAIYTRDIGPRLGEKQLLKLTEDECWDAVYDKAKGSKHMANKLAGELSCFLRWCAGREGRMAGIPQFSHPALTLNSNWFATGPKANSRFLDKEEIGLLFRALVDEDRIYRRGLVLLLLTAARRNELFAAPAREVVDGMWTLPAERSKNHEANYVALGPWGQHLARTNQEWLFPSPRVDGPQLFGWFKARDRIHRRMETLAGRPVPRWHFHDLRRTFRSHARGLGIDRDIAELMLNHKRTGIEGVYDKNLELGLRAAGFAAWEKFLVGIAEDVGVADTLGARVCLAPPTPAPRAVGLRFLLPQPG